MPVITCAETLQLDFYFSLLPYCLFVKMISFKSTHKVVSESNSTDSNTLLEKKAFFLHVLFPGHLSFIVQ